MRAPCSLPLLLTVSLLGLGCDAETKTELIGTPDTSASTTATDSADSTDGQDGTAAGDGTDSTDATDGSESTDSADAADATDGVDGVIPDGEDLVCADGGEPGHATGYPFTGLKVTPSTPKSQGISYDFTCTKCPKGYGFISGTYRRYTDENPGLPKPSDEWETWSFEGNAFTSVINAIDAKENGGDGERHTVTSHGYYFCPPPSELGDMDSIEFWNVVLVYTDVSEEGVFGITAGAADLCFLGASTDGNGKDSEDIGLGCNLFWDPKGTWQQTDTYCKVGSTVLGRPCEDPSAGQ